jgi:serpin B
MRTFTFVLALALCLAYTMAENEPLRAVADSTGTFSTKLFKNLASKNQDKNFISSPLSAHAVLSMAAYGAGGNTAVQMRQSLALPEDDTVGRAGFENLFDALNNTPNVTLEVANKIYVQKGLKLKAEYKQLTAGTFRSEAAEMDVSKPEEVVKDVNAWADEKTHHKINKILEQDDVTQDSRMFMLNAVYFKGNWKTKFDKKLTQDRPFHVNEKTEKQVPTMFINGNFYYGELPDLKAKFIELPYDNEDLKMVIIVPNEINGLKDIEENLESFNQTRLASSGYNTDVLLYLPKFKIESTIPLEEPLKELGMTDMFNNAANFSGIAEEPLKVAKVLQKAFIEVNEEGSEAAAVTVMIAMPGSAAPAVKLPIFNVDRPSYFKIVDKKKSILLFSGHILEP